MNSESFTIEKFRKGKKRVIDVRKQVESLVESGERIPLKWFSSVKKARHPASLLRYLRQCLI